MTKILLVEDNEMNRDMLSRRLKRRGFEVVIAVDGAIGVKLAQSEHPDLILMDMSLPVLDGWEATKQIKAMPHLASIPVIALTAHAMVGDREKTLEAGCDDYDTKPVEIKRLLGKIEALLQSSQPMVETSVVEQSSQGATVQSDSEPLMVGSAVAVSEEPDLAISSKTPSSHNVDANPILVVDDNLMNREVLGRRLGKVGYQIHFAETGEEALSVLEAENISLVLLDVMMPGIGGWETLRRIRLQFTAAELPVIMVTAKDQSEDIVKAFSLGANDYITKPIDFPITLARVQSQLQLLQLSQSNQPSDSQPKQENALPSTAASPSPVIEDPVVSTSHRDSFGNKEKRSLFQILSLPDDASNHQANGSDLLNNQYKIFEQLDKTDYFQTFLAYDTHQETEQVVSIQRLSFPGSIFNSTILSKFEQEIERFRLAFTDEAPSIIRLLNTFAQGNRIYLVKEYVEGSLLSAEITSGRPHTTLYAINVLGRLLEILSVLHKHNFALQDFSAGSFTRRKRDGEIILTELNLANRLLLICNQAEHAGQANAAVQSPVSIDFGEDLYTVGCIAIQALTGVAPQRYDGIHAQKRLEWKTEFDVNTQCADYINRLIHPDKTQRFRDATHAHHELLKSHLLLHAVKHNMRQTGKIL